MKRDSHSPPKYLLAYLKKFVLCELELIVNKRRISSFYYCCCLSKRLKKTQSTKMVVGEKFQLKHYFDGMPKPEDFTLVKEELPDLKDGEILVSALFLSVDPYMRPYTRRIPLSAYPITMIGQSVQKVIESKDKEFPKGCNVMCNIGWVKTGMKIQDIYEI